MLILFVQIIFYEYICCVKILTNSNFKIYVYPNDHPPPHCHVVFRDGTDITVDLPLIEVRYGAKISKEIKVAIEEALDKICDAWDALNPIKNN
jgi:hypothetical protein